MIDKDSYRFEMTREELIEDTKIGRPHVVILGAGASKAAFPNGDRNGLKLPQMNDLVETIGLEETFIKYGIPYKDINFEEIYDELSDDEENKPIIEAIDGQVWNYFNRLKLPDNPTIYDYLVLSLRDKDLIATFNWDPFLYQACWRYNKQVKLPNVAYLHGNVSIGFCLTDRRKGLIDRNCSVCNKPYTPSKLLYPIKKKDYSADPFINSEWDGLRQYLEDAYMLTIFGYSAPDSDVEAIELMKNAWGKWEDRNLEQVELIDIKDETTLRNTWGDFIHTHHFDYFSDFFQSSLSLFPRRTCEAQWNSTMEVRFLKQNPVPRDLAVQELLDWYSPLFEAEKNKA